MRREQQMGGVISLLWPVGPVIGWGFLIGSK